MASISNLTSRSKSAGNSDRDGNKMKTCNNDSNAEMMAELVVPDPSQSSNAGKGRSKKSKKWQKLDFTYDVSASTSNLRPGWDMLKATQENVAKPYKNMIAQSSSHSRPNSQPTTWYDLNLDCRYLIYELLCQDSRILELQWDGPLVNPGSDAHYKYRPTAKARRAPSILHLNKEAREWALREKEKGSYYRLVNFASLRMEQDANGDWHSNMPVLLYYNPKVDIPYLGPNTCMQPVVEFIKNMHIKGISMPRIALLCSGAITSTCHDWDDDDIIDGPNEYVCELGHAIAGGCTPMQALHGMPKEIAWNNKVPGIAGLTDVFWIVPSLLVDMAAGKIENTISMRAATHNGLTDGQVKFNERIKRQVKLVTDGEGLSRCKEELNRWVGKRVPNFHFKSFCHRNPSNDGKYYDAIIVPESDVWKLTRWARAEWLLDIQEKYKCSITVPERDFAKAKVREVGFFGREDQIKLAKEAVLDRIENWLPPNQKKCPNGGWPGDGKKGGGRGRGGKGSRGGGGLVH